MKKVHLYATVFTLLLTLLPLAAAQKVDPSGDWDVTLNTPQGTYNFKASFKQAGEKLSCVLRNQAGELPCEAIVTGNTIKVSYKVSFQGSDMPITMTGNIDGSTIKGDADFGGMAQGDWTAKLAELGATAAMPATPSPSATTGGIDGDWDLAISSPQGTHNVRASFTRSGDKIKGFLTGPNGQLPLDGSIQGKDLKFSFTVKYEGNDLLINMAGKLEGDDIKGAADFGGMAQGDWAAKRAAAGGSNPTGAASTPKVGNVDVTGTWLFQVETSMGSGTPTMTFKQEGERLTGHYKGLLGEADLGGTVKGNAIAFSFKISVEGMQGTVTYTGAIENDTMKGTARFGDMGKGAFTAKRQ